MNNTYDHVAFATTDTDKSMAVFEVLGFKKQLHYKQKIDKFDSYITKLESPNGEILELVEPCTGKSVVKRILNGQSATVYHSAFLTDNLTDTLDKLKTMGAMIITEPMAIPYPSSPAHQDYKTSHVYHPNVGLFEVTGP